MNYEPHCGLMNSLRSLWRLSKTVWLVCALPSPEAQVFLHAQFFDRVFRSIVGAGLTGSD